jgi:maleylpyruvate isomerase
VLELKTGIHAGSFLTESLGIIRFLEETHPEAPTLFPGTALDHARIWALAETINSGTHPLQNIPVMAMHSDDPEAQRRWAQHWIRQGLEVFEKLASREAGSFAYGDHFSLADVCLIPQLYNAERYQVDLSAFPQILRAKAKSAQIPALLKAHPDRFNPESPSLL